VLRALKIRVCIFSWSGRPSLLCPLGTIVSEVIGVPLNSFLKTLPATYVEPPKVVPMDTIASGHSEQQE